jgi:hypothetical protein
VVERSVKLRVAPFTIQSIGQHWAPQASRKIAYVSTAIGVGSLRTLRNSDFEPTSREMRRGGLNQRLEIGSVDVVVLLRSRTDKHRQLWTEPEAADTREHGWLDEIRARKAGYHETLSAETVGE